MHLLLKPALILTLFFVLLVAGINLRPYDSGNLGAFLMPSGSCSLPCFMEIHPGITTGDEALAILDANEWVNRIMVSRDRNEDASLINWNWAEKPGEFINEDQFATIRLWDNTVQQIFVPTNAAFGEIWLLFGQPSGGKITVTESPLGLYLYTVYSDQRVISMSSLACPIRYEDVWKTQVILQFTTNALVDRFNDVYLLSDWMQILPCV